MSYFRGNFHGHGMPNYVPQGSARFGILPVTRPRMPPGGMNQFQGRNQGNFGGGGNYWGSPRNPRPRGGGGGMVPARGETIRLGPSNQSKPSESKSDQPSTSTGKKEEPKKAENKKGEEKKAEETKKADDQEKDPKKNSDVKEEESKPEDKKDKKEGNSGSSTPAAVTIKEEESDNITKPEDAEKAVKVKAETPIIKLDTYNSELHMCISPNQYEGWNMKGPGFEYMWGGVRATHGVSKGKVCYEVHLLENCKVKVPDEKSPYVARVGWSVDGSDYQLGEDKLSWGYGGTGKASSDSKFKDYGKPFSAGDVVTCYVDLDANPKAMFFMLNGQYLGVAFRFTNELDGNAVYPHVACKNMKFRVNFGQDPPKHALTSNFRMMQSLSAEELQSPPPGPSKPEEAEMIMMVGLPACGKSVWCENYAKEHKDKKYYILGTNLIIDRMKVTGLIRKRNYHGRWEELIKRASSVLNKLFDVAKKRPRNYILDQTNVYFTARRRKMESFRGYKRIAAVIVNSPAILAERTDKQRKDEGKLVPEEAVMEMKKNFSLPEVGPSFDDIWYVEEQLPVSRNLVEAYRAEGIAFKNKKPFPQANRNNEPLAKKAKVEDRPTAPNRGFSNSNRGFQPSEQQPAKLMETGVRESNIPSKPDNRIPNVRDVPPKRDERPDIRKDIDRDRSGSRDRRSDRGNERGRDSGHRDDRRGPSRDERREFSSRGDRRDPPRSDRRELPPRDSREPMRDNRELSRDDREHSRDIREPRDIRELPLRDNRREPMRDNRSELFHRDMRREPHSRDDRREPLSRDRGGSLDSNSREAVSARGESLRDLSAEASRLPVGGNFPIPPRDMRGLPRDDFGGPHDAKDILGREMRNPYRDVNHPDLRENQRRYPDWREENFEDEYRSQASQDRVETFKRDLPLGRDSYRDPYYDDPRNKELTDGRYNFKPKMEDDRRGDLLISGGIPPPRGSTSIRNDAVPPYEQSNERFGRHLDERSYSQGFGSTSDYKNDRLPSDAARRDFDRPVVGAAGVPDDQLKPEPVNTYPELHGRYEGRPDMGDNKFGIGDPTYEAKPDRHSLDQLARLPLSERGGGFGGYRDYPTSSYPEQDKNPPFTGRGDLNHPDAMRYDQSRFGPIKTEPSRTEMSRPEQSHYDQPWMESGWSDHSRSDLNRPDMNQTRTPPKEQYPSSHYNQPKSSMDQGNKPLMDIQVSDYGRRAELDQKKYERQFPTEETSRFELGKADEITSYSSQGRPGYDQKSGRYEPPGRQDRFDSSGRPFDHANPSGALTSDFSGGSSKPADDWHAPSKLESSGRYSSSSYGQGPTDRMAADNQFGYYQGQGATERQGSYRGDGNRYQSQVHSQPAPESYGDQAGRGSADQSHGSASQYQTNKSGYGGNDIPGSTYEEHGGTTTSAGGNKSVGYSFTSNSNQNYTNDRMSYSYQTQMTTSTANYSQMTGAGGSAFPVQKYGGEPPSRPADSAMPSSQQTYGRPPNDPVTSIGSAPTHDNYPPNYGSGGGGGDGNANQSYEQQQQDYQKAYKQWYANYAQAYAQLAQQQPK